MPMKRILSDPKRTVIGFLIFLFALETVALFAGAVTAYFQKTPSNEFGIGLLAAVAFSALALFNLFAFAVTYFLSIKVIKVDRYPGLLWSLMTGIIAPVLVFASQSQEHAEYYFFGPYVFLICGMALGKIYTMIRR